MFVSLNKKILYTIGIFFILTFMLFVLTFYIVFGQRFMEEQNLNVLNILNGSQTNYENVVFHQELEKIREQHPDLAFSSQTNELLLQRSKPTSDINIISNEHQRVTALIKDYETRYNSFDNNLKIILISVLLILVLILILAMLLQRWILIPINKLSQISDLVSSGDLSQRVPIESQPFFRDEISKLTLTFNQMLENLNKSFNEIKNKEYFLQSLIDSIPDGIRVIDEDYNIIIANQTYYQQIAKPDKERKKCFFSSQQADVPCSVANIRCPLEEITQKNLPHIKVIQQFKGTPGTHYSINAAPMAILDPEGKKQTYIVESIRDLSDDIEFSHQQKLSSLGFMATSVAHEMKNHLGSIRMISEALIGKHHPDSPLTAEEQQYLELIHHQICECIKVPERLLSLSRSRNEPAGNINCSAGIHEVAALLDYEAKRQGSQIIINTPVQDIHLYGNETDFKMMLINLAQNSLRAIKENGIIKIDLQQTQSGNTAITVSDNGCGISSADLPRIFDPFFTTRQGSERAGNGLGLTIVKSIVEKLGGEISIDSTPGKGTNVKLSFPAFRQKS